MSGGLVEVDYLPIVLHKSLQPTKEDGLLGNEFVLIALAKVPLIAGLHIRDPIPLVYV